jgi:hypothetical protein
VVTRGKIPYVGDQTSSRPLQLQRSTEVGQINMSRAGVEYKVPLFESAPENHGYFRRFEDFDCVLLDYEAV